MTDRERAADTNDRRPIGVFDSGVGGLTVWKALHEEFPSESFIYLGDTARVPYGNKSASTVARYATNIATSLVEMGCKALVIACNTASAYAGDAVAAAVDVPTVDVVGPVSEQVAREAGGTVAVLGTRGTVSSQAYVEAIHRVDPTRRVVQQACPLFVPLAEEGWTEGAIPEQIAHAYLDALCASEAPRDFILGCTHYPLLRSTLLGVLTRALGEPPRLHDSGIATAGRLREILAARNLLARGDARPPRWLVTDSPNSFATVAQRFLGRAPRGVEHIDLADRGSPTDQ